jgi:hypothetical protein
MKVRILLPLAIALAALIGGEAGAHHSFAMFEETKTVKIKGAVKEVKWTNPHVWVYLMGATEGETEAAEWGIEFGAPSTLERNGWKRNTLKPGDEVTFVARPMKNGTKAGSYISVTLPDGRVLSGTVMGHVAPKDEEPAAAAN